MPTVRLKLKKLTDVGVEYISLVKRGANRIPIRVVKSEDVNTSEDNMDLLKNLFTSKQVEETSEAPVVTSILLKQADWNEAVEKELVELGFSVEDKEELEEGFIFKQEGFESEDTVIKLNDFAFITVKNVTKAFEPFSSSGSFSENFKKGGFFPNVRMATDVLMDTIVNVMFSAEGNTVPVEAVQKSLDEFSNFVVTSLKSIPKDAFKVEDIVNKAMKSSNDNKETELKTEDTVDKVEIKKQVEEFLTSEQEVVLKKLEAMKVDIEKTLKSIQENVTSQISKLDEDLKALKEVSEGFDKKLVATTEKVEAVENTVKGATASGSSDADAEETAKKAEVKKSDDEIWGDTLTVLDGFGSGE